MKHFDIIILIASVWFAISCGGNRMKNNEKVLIKEILTEELKLASDETVRLKRELQLTDSIAKLPIGFRFKEDRSVDPRNPPVIIDFASETPSRELKLSDIARKITYIKLRVPGDSLYFSTGMGGNVSFTNDNIILNNNLGVHRFSRTGEYIEQIANSNIQIRQIDKKSLPGYFEKETYRGIWVNHVSTAGNRVFYKFSDYPNGKVSLLNYEIKPGIQTLNLALGKEQQSDKAFTKGMVVTEGKEATRSGTPGLSSTQILGVSSNFYTGVPDVLKANDNALMMTTFNLNGDTLCKFTQFDKLETPITSQVIRSISTIINWHFKGIFSFKRAFNDTIFRLIPPNRIVPVFVLNFGASKITTEEWYHFGRSLSGKIDPEDIIENEKFIFIRYTFFISNDSRGTRYALYDKINKKIYRLPLNNELKNKRYNAPFKQLKWSAGLENDLDNGFPFWPDFVTPEGDFGITIRPSALKGMLQKHGFDPKAEKSGKLKLLTEDMGSDNNELILMTVE